MSTSVFAPPSPPLIERQPWLGLASYSEADSELFFGREKEGLELLRFVRREVLTILFGPSGTGKTSLLNAGLLPRLRQSGFLPIMIRLDHSGDRPDYVEQIRALITNAAHTDRAHPVEEDALAPPQTAPGQETLWEYLHRVVFWDWRNNPVTPVLVFDQFEEIFTLGRNHAAIEELFAGLADLVENYIPSAVRSRMQVSGGTIPFSHNKPKYKAVLSLREDFVSRLDGLRKAMPSVMHNRYAITRMNGEQALRAVREPGRGIVEEPVAHRIVRFVAATNESRADVDGEGIRLEDLRVDPALLSVVCRELNTRRIADGKHLITVDLLQQAGTDILNDFYERCYAGLNPAVRAFVEDRLLTASGCRSTVPLEEATQAGIAEDILALVDRRLIRTEERLGIPHLELTHDLLTKVVQKSRVERQEREQRERERQQREREDLERARREEHRQEELRRARRLLVIVGCAGSICLLAGILAWVSYQRAESEKGKVELASVQLERANDDLKQVKKVLLRQNGWTDARIEHAGWDSLQESLQANEEIYKLPRPIPGVAIFYHPKSADSIEGMEALFQYWKSIGYEPKKIGAQNSKPSNFVWFYSSIPVIDLKRISLSLIRAGIEVRAINRRPGSGSQKVEIGYEEEFSETSTVESRRNC